MKLSLAYWGLDVLNRLKHRMACITQRKSKPAHYESFDVYLTSSNNASRPATENSGGRNIFALAMQRLLKFDVSELLS